MASRADPTRAQRVRFVTADGVRLSALYWPGGAADRPGGAADRPGGAADRPGAPAYVVAHGFTGSARAAHVARIAGRLAGRRGADVLSLDFRGHGRSRGASTVGDAEVLDVAAAVQWLRARPAPSVAVLGWSMGGSVVLRYAGLGGDADAVVAISSPAHWYERGTAAMRVVHWVCESATGRVAALLARGTRLSWRGWPEVPASPVEVVGGIGAPLLLVHGEQDHYFPRRHAELLAAAAPSAELWLEPGMGHAETATTPQLVDRIDEWVRAALTRTSADPAGHPGPSRPAGV